MLLTGWAVLADAGLPSAGHPADLAEVDVLVPAGRRVADRSFVRVHRAAGPMPGGLRRDDGLWSTTVARALADLAPGADGQRRYRALCAEAVQRRRCELGELLDQLLARPDAAERPGVARVVEELAAGVRSVAEGETRELAARHRAAGAALEPGAAPGRPLPRRTGRLLAGRLRGPGDRLARLAPVPGRPRARPGPANRLTAAGLPVVRATPLQLRRDPGPVLEQLRTLLATGPHAAHRRISWQRARR
ncbi:hypothetical protein ACWGB8_18025 [Kitasatospora sp. NPDC054939]